MKTIVTVDDKKIPYRIRLADVEQLVDLAKPLVVGAVSFVGIELPKDFYETPSNEKLYLLLFGDEWKIVNKDLQTVADKSGKVQEEKMIWIGMALSLGFSDAFHLEKFLSKDEIEQCKKLFESVKKPF